MHNDPFSLDLFTIREKMVMSPGKLLVYQVLIIIFRIEIAILGGIPVYSPILRSTLL